MRQGIPRKKRLIWIPALVIGVALSVALEALGFSGQVVALAGFAMAAAYVGFVDWWRAR